MARKPADADSRSALSKRAFIGWVVLLGGGSFVGAAAGVGAARACGAVEPTPDRPAASGAMLDVRDFGATGDGEANDTRAIQRVIDAGAGRGGAVVRLPAGTWRSGTLQLRSRVTFEPPGPVLLASPDDGDFAAREALPFDTDSDSETTDFAHALVAGLDLERVAITGGGVIDLHRTERSGPKAIALKRCRFVGLHDVHGGLGHANLQPGAAGLLARVSGENTANLTLMGAGPAEFGPEISPKAVTRVVTARQPESG